MDVSRKAPPAEIAELADQPSVPAATPQNDAAKVQYPPGAIHLWVAGQYHGCFRGARVLDKVDHFFPKLTGKQRAEVVSEIARMRAFQEQHADSGAWPMLWISEDGRAWHGTRSEDV